MIKQVTAYNLHQLNTGMHDEQLTETWNEYQ